MAKRSQTYPSLWKYLAEPGLFSFYRSPRLSGGPLFTSNAVDAFHAYFKRKFDGKAGPSFYQERALLIAIEMERCNRLDRNRRLTGFDELTAEDLRNPWNEKIKII